MAIRSLAAGILALALALPCTSFASYSYYSKETTPFAGIEFDVFVMTDATGAAVSATTNGFTISINDPPCEAGLPASRLTGTGTEGSATRFESFCFGPRSVTISWSQTDETVRLFSSDTNMVGAVYRIDVQSVPEPSSWALTGVGLGLLGWTIRRNRRASRRAAVGLRFVEE